MLLDKSLVNMYCTDTIPVSLRNVKPGRRMLTVVPAQNNHVDVMANSPSITVNYEPAAPGPAIGNAASSAAPPITIVLPKPGATVSGSFDVVVEVKNFHLSCDLYDKPDVADYGYWQLNFDIMEGQMMGMATTAGMSCYGCCTRRPRGGSRVRPTRSSRCWRTTRTYHCSPSSPTRCRSRCDEPGVAP